MVDPARLIASIGHRFVVDSESWVDQIRGLDMNTGNKDILEISMSLQVSPLTVKCDS